MPHLPVNGNPLPPRRLLIVANPISGGGRSKVLVPALCAELDKRGITAQPYFTTAAGDGAARARAAANEGWDGLVAVGGDGTVNEVLNGMPDPSAPLGVLPVGTANVLARELHLPRQPAAAAALLASGTLRSLAIGLAGDRRFLLFCGVGVDGAVVQRLSEVRKGTLGMLKWTGPILHVVRRWPRYALSATFADGSSLDDLSSVLVTRVRNYGGFVHLTRDISVDDGFLHVLCFRMRSRTAWLWQGARAFAGRLVPGPHLEVRKTTAVQITGNAPYQLDGDHGSHTPVTVTVLGTRARLFAPPL